MSEQITSGEKEVDEEAEALAALQTHIDEASFLLTRWQRSKDSDSVRRQNMRKSEYGQACGHLRKAVYSGPRLGLELTVVIAEDSEPVRTVSLSKGAYDSIETHRSSRNPLNPGETFPLKRERTLNYVLRQVSNVYFGDYGRYLDTSDIAEILANGGKLEFVPIEPKPETPEATPEP